MTPTQIDHLRRIDALCAKLLDIAEKRTPGSWEADDRCVSDVNGIISRTSTGNDFEDKPNAAFIAACAGNAEAGWKATRSMIDYLLMMHKHGDGYRYIGLTEDILAAFPLETLNTTTP